MARRIGAERFQHWTHPPEQFGQEGEPYMVAEYTGCWPNFTSSDEGIGDHRNAARTLVEVWIPSDFKVLDADDYLVWAKYPDEKYLVAGDVGRLVNRRGSLRATTIPVEVRR